MTTLKAGTQITPREMQVLELIKAGHSNKSIAQILGITLDTAKAHTSHLFDKTGCDSRIRLAVKFATPRPVEDRVRDLLIKKVKITHQLAAVNEELALLGDSVKNQ